MPSRPASHSTSHTSSHATSPHVSAPHVSTPHVSTPSAHVTAPSVHVNTPASHINGSAVPHTTESHVTVIAPHVTGTRLPLASPHIIENHSVVVPRAQIPLLLERQTVVYRSNPLSFNPYFYYFLFRPSTQTASTTAYQSQSSGATNYQGQQHNGHNVHWRAVGLVAFILIAVVIIIHLLRRD